MKNKKILFILFFIMGKGIGMEETNNSQQEKILENGNNLYQPTKKKLISRSIPFIIENGVLYTFPNSKKNHCDIIDEKVIEDHK